MSSVSTKEPKDSKMSKSEFFQEQLQLSSIALSSLCHFVVRSQDSWLKKFCEKNLEKRPPCQIAQSFTRRVIVVVAAAI